MPGIYLRKAKWINWINREGPILTVPGSYWLCYKSKIYKFIFRYHRTTRNFEDFIYGRELMKIIRRIIKNQPGQGQQFGTSHLLVTYNYTSWTRQDKAFALLKFRERSVTAFSHAFVLTIKIMHSVENSEQMVPQFCFSDKSVVNTNGKESEKENRRLQNTSKSNLPERSNEYNIQDKTVEAENKSIQLDCNLRKTSTNEHSARDAPNYSDANKVTKTSTVWSEVSVMQYLSPESKTKFYNKAKENRSHNLNNKDSTSLNSVEHKVEENEAISNRSNISINDSINNNDKLFEANHYVIENDLVESVTKKSESVNKKLLSINTVDSTNIDSINLPYQYLMEKEVEDAKRTLNDHEIKNDAPSYSNSMKHKLEEANENYSANPVGLFTNTVKAKDVLSPKRKKLPPDLSSRSSDITNLVMEGLMFTIRQEQDTVSVIEQKTKLEVDEVLENSEKIETMKGEKCLRNSSLLGLENLITLIELPSRTEAKRRCENTIVQENVSESQSRHKLLLPSNNEIRQQNVERRLKYKQWQHAFAASTSFTNSNKSQEIYEKHKYNKRTKIKKNEYPEYEEEEEDIVPEALQDEIFQSSVSSFQERNTPNNDLKVMVNKDLLMDDMDDTESSKTSNYKSLNRSNVPIIVSNQIITADQIPLPLRKIIKNQLQAANIVRVSESNDKISKRQLRDENVENRNLRSRVVKHTSKNDTVQNTHYLENSKELIPSISNTCNESTLSVTSDVKLETDNATDYSVNVNKEKSEAQSVTNKEEQLLFNPVQDVTKQLYQELSYMQRKKNGIDLKCLRSRRALKGSDDEVRLEMVKFFNDITRGAKVVVRRMSSKSIHRILGKSSTLSTCMQY